MAKGKFYDGQTKFYIVNKNRGGIGGHNYGSERAAEEVIAAMFNGDVPVPDCNVLMPVVRKFKLNHVNLCFTHPKEFNGQRVTK